MSKVSPLWQSITRNFEDWARKIRFFVDRDHAEPFESTKTKAEVCEAIRGVAVEIVNEPPAGADKIVESIERLSPNSVDLVPDKLVEINKAGTSILLVEQNARMALEVCHRAYVFEIGRIALSGNRESCWKMSESRRRIWAHSV